MVLFYRGVDVNTADHFHLSGFSHVLSLRTETVHAYNSLLCIPFKSLQMLPSHDNMVSRKKFYLITRAIRCEPLPTREW